LNAEAENKISAFIGEIAYEKNHILMITSCNENKEGKGM